MFANLYKCLATRTVRGGRRLWCAQVVFRIFFHTSSKEVPGGSGQDDFEPPSFETSLPPSIPEGFQPLRLIDSEVIANNTKLLSFELPKGVSNLRELHVPTGVKVRKEVQPGVVHNKSYSLVSLPSNSTQIDIVVKRYAPRETGEGQIHGLGAFMCNDLNIGDSIDIKFKPRKLFSGKPYEPNRFENIVFVGNGTGVAPLYQMALHVLENDPSDSTNVWFISAHRTEEDIILGDELEALHEKHGDGQFRSNTVILSQPQGKDGRYIDTCDFDNVPLPSSANDVSTTHVVVCGTDGFLEHVCGMTSFRYEEDGTKHKQQGELKGLLKRCGFSNSSVTKL